MSSVKFLVASLVLIALSSIACASGKVPSAAPSGPAPVPGREPTKEITQESWQQKWENTQKAARQEGRIVVYVSSIAPSLKESMGLLKKQYGLNLEVITGRGSELRGKLLQERNNGIFIADVLISGLNTIFGVVKQSGMADPIEPALIIPEVLDTRLWYGGKLPWGDEERKVFSFINGPKPLIGVNTGMVSPRDLQSYFDLLDPKWKGKIIINDPTITGTAFDSYSSLIYHKVVNLDFFRQLVGQQTQILRDMRLQVDWLAKGRFPIALWAHEAYMTEFMNAGAPVAWVNMKEGTVITSVGGNLVLVNRAAHPNAARIFINWFLSKEGQSIVQNLEQAQSARDDLLTGSLDPLRVRQQGGKYFRAVNENEEWVLKEQDRYLETARQIFAPLFEK